MSALLVVAHPDVRLLCRTELELVGYHVLDAELDLDAAWQMTEHHLAVVVLDLAIDEERKAWGLHWLQASAAYHNIFCMALADDAADGIAALEAGADVVLVKPFSLGEFLLALQQRGRRDHRPAAPRTVPDAPLLPTARRTVVA